MNIIDSTVWLSRYILQDNRFRRICHYPGSTMGDYSIIGKIESVENKKFLGLIKYRDYNYFYEFEVIKCENLIRVTKHDFELLKEDLIDIINEYEKLTNYNVRIKIVNSFVHFID